MSDNAGVKVSFQILRRVLRSPELKDKAFKQRSLDGGVRFITAEELADCYQNIPGEEPVWVFGDIAEIAEKIVAEGKEEAMKHE